MVYRLSREVSFDSLSEQLKDFRFASCSGSQASSYGWVPPSEQLNELLHQPTGKISLFRCKTETKSLPAGAVKEGVAAKTNALEKREGRPVRRKETRDIKEDVTKHLVERAIGRFDFVRVLIAHDIVLTNQNGDHVSETLIVLDASTRDKAENVLALLRKTVGSLPAVPLTTHVPIEDTLTKWVASGSNVAGGFEIGSSATLKSILENGGEITCKEQELHSDEILLHIENHKLVTSLQLIVDGCQFTLKNDLSITKVSFDNEVKDKNLDISAEDFAARFDADLLLFSDCFQTLIGRLSAALGGVECNV